MHLDVSVTKSLAYCCEYSVLVSLNHFQVLKNVKFKTIKKPLIILFYDLAPTYSIMKE